MLKCNYDCDTCDYEYCIHEERNPDGLEDFAYSDTVYTGDLCKECNMNDSCNDTECPVYKYRKDKDL